MKATLKSNYVSKTSRRPVFVFEVSGSDAELVKYKEAQGENYRQSDEDIPLYFSMSPQSCVKRGDTINLVITTNNNVVVDDLAAAIARANKIEAKQDEMIAIGTSVVNMEPSFE